MWFFLYWSCVDLLSFSSLVAQLVKNPRAMWQIWVQPLGWEDFPGEGKGNSFQYSDVENSMDCTVYGVEMSQARLSNFHFLSLWIDNFRPFTNFGQYFSKYFSVPFSHSSPSGTANKHMLDIFILSWRSPSLHSFYFGSFSSLFYRLDNTY